MAHVGLTREDAAVIMQRRSSGALPLADNATSVMITNGSEVIIEVICDSPKGTPRELKGGN